MREEVIPANLSTKKKQGLDQKLCWKTLSSEESKETLKAVDPGREGWRPVPLGPSIHSRGEEEAAEQLPRREFRGI